MAAELQVKLKRGSSEKKEVEEKEKQEQNHSLLSTPPLTDT